MKSNSIWQDTARKPMESVFLDRNVEVDVAIIGAGITGLTTALELLEQGLSVALLESFQAGDSSTGQSTGNLYTTVSEGLAKLEEKWGREVTARVVASRQAAIDAIERRVNDHDIDCGFMRSPWYRLAPNPTTTAKLQHEYQASLNAGLDAKLLGETQWPLPAQETLVIENQAQFNPRQYARGLARIIKDKGGHLFEHSPVHEYDTKEGRVRCDRGQVIARDIVLATHTPKGIRVLHTEVAPYREYGVALKMTGRACPEGAFWDMEPPYSVRNYRYQGEDYLLVIGEMHKTGEQAGSEGRYEKIEQYARRHFDVGEVTHRWSAQNYKAADCLPYIGRPWLSKNLYTATGFATDGLVYGTLAAMMISSQIAGDTNEWQDLYSPTRLTPAKSASRLVKDNLDVGRHFIQDYTGTGKASSLSEIPLDEGRLMKHNGEYLAVYRSEGAVQTVSAVCTHMRCLVHWNEAESSWDCPCHGSRFNRNGDVLEGPALQPLEIKKDVF